MLTVYCDSQFSDELERALREGLAAHRLVYPATRQRTNLLEAAPDPALLDAEVAFGQPPVRGLLQAPRLRWVHITSAGYARYDTPEVRNALAAKGTVLTNSSTVYADPCAEHLLAMMLAMARRLPDSLDAQRTNRSWESDALRVRSFLLKGRTVLLLGYGAIGRRLSELLAPFGARLLIVRRNAVGDEPGVVVRESELDAALAAADHVANVLPDSAATRGFLSAARIARLREGAFVYNVGRGSTVDEPALVAALASGKLGGAYLDVTAEEPLPPEHPLWSLPNCYITPHTAGGRREEHLALVEHFLDNLARFERGERLIDRVI
ncbi:D-2-hydroxyacid dehydrogenase [Polyangium aurulentum]|uniref:D-2-hydroxyacid dehydrogenase n=1 Tax=Polyangium aurulentum TaxID=2567896 RepID=UPI0010AEA6F8|nr:D-2-hydroxyacid dehydrogenase [Polyangium aurulentum]UQA56797.1 D-2-hydroxyacid dehydrogenase [Polyangium aurulentum]